MHDDATPVNTHAPQNPHSSSGSVTGQTVVSHAHQDNGNGMNTVAWLIALAGWSILLSFYHLDGGAEFEPTDCWVAQTAREMLEADEWIIPVFSGETRLQKSPGPYWAVMGLSELHDGEVTKVTARMPNAIAGVLLVLTVFWLTGHIAGDRAAVFAGFATLSSVVFLYWTHRAASDFGLASLMTTSLAFLWVASAMEPPGLRRNLYWLIGYLFAGLAMLYKMPMPLVCIGLPAWIWLITRKPGLMGSVTIFIGISLGLYKLRDSFLETDIDAFVSLGEQFETQPWLMAIPAGVAGLILLCAGIFYIRYVIYPGIWHLLGLALFFLPWLPWVWAVYEKEGATALYKWRVEYFDRFTGALPNVQEQTSWEFYLLYLMVPLVFVFPYSLSIPLAIWRGFKPPAYADRGGMRFMLIWFFSLLVFLTLSVGKETRYFLPAVPPLLVLLGVELSEYFDPKRRMSSAWVTLSSIAAYLGVPIALVGGVFGLQKWQEHNDFIPWSAVWPPYLVMAIILGIGFLVAIRLYVVGRRNASFGMLVTTMCVAWLWIWPQFMPIMGSEKPFIQFAEKLRDKLPADSGYREKLRMIGSQDSRITWYGDIRFPRIIDQLDLLEMQGGERSLEREKELVGEEMADQLNGDELVLLLAGRPDYIEFRLRAPAQLRKQGKTMPDTYIWLQTELGPKRKHFVVFGNEPPPWGAVELDPPSSILEQFGGE